MYSRIPMPHFKWDSDDMKYHLIFFPWVGSVIGILEFLLFYLYDKYELNQIAFALLAMVIPLVVTGGFHLDGFMDVSDALSSWQTKEKRLEILKDPHIGAFAVINVAAFGMTMLALLILMKKDAFIVWIFSFFITRCFSGMCVVRCRKAKQEGLLHTEAKTASEKIVFVVLLIELSLGLIEVGICNPIYAATLLLAAGIMAMYCVKKAYKMFGGITGDVMGWYVVLSELVMAFAVTMISLFI